MNPDVGFNLRCHTGCHRRAPEAHRLFLADRGVYWKRDENDHLVRSACRTHLPLTSVCILKAVDSSRSRLSRSPPTGHNAARSVNGRTKRKTGPASVYNDISGSFEWQAVMRGRIVRRNNFRPFAVYSIFPNGLRAVTGLGFPGFSGFHADSSTAIMIATVIASLAADSRLRSMRIPCGNTLGVVILSGTSSTGTTWTLGG